MISVIEIGKSIHHITIKVKANWFTVVTAKDNLVFNINEYKRRIKHEM